ncbi:hypothetical protein BO78DRAFT_16902 [Aspergillus sclerotiicarbonarius CBS 121057]|uniref:Secreted protein n=1 Tax=Aspergillus sclerotiicarbonarius (strain CBS 121057 / IBT 28362) TaxID=1448318 RepID=A0A319DVS5_ASPSB|nr:hypothetical protein BO78DRAFT_16902 [Aspergillus sclerotiicarbonarius CBS 121057]
MQSHSPHTNAFKTRHLCFSSFFLACIALANIRLSPNHRCIRGWLYISIRYFSASRFTAGIRFTHARCHNRRGSAQCLHSLARLNNCHSADITVDAPPYHPMVEFSDSLLSRRMCPRSFQIATLAAACNQGGSGHRRTDFLHTFSSFNRGTLRYTLHNTMVLWLRNLQGCRWTTAIRRGGPDVFPRLVRGPGETMSLSDII